MAASLRDNDVSRNKLKSPAQSELNYVLDPCPGGRSPHFKVKLSFKGNETGIVKIKLPSEWAGQAKLYECIKRIRASSPDTVLTDTADPQIKVITHRPRQVITIIYQVHPSRAGNPADPGFYYRPILQKEYFHFIGEGFFIHPAWDDEQLSQIVIQWKNLPHHWIVSNSFGNDQHRQMIKRTLAQLRHAIYIGGDFRIKKILIKGHPLYVALRGRWAFSDRSYFKLVKKIVEAERAFWRDYDFPYFLITLIPTSEQCSTYGGTGLTDSFASFAPPGRPIDAHLKHLLAHELFHAWNGRKVGRQQPEELVYWFSEGFTEYYTRLLLLRSGLMTLEEYIRDYNRVIFNYYSSPVRTAKNREILKYFWTNTLIRQLPYWRGDILAHNWNAAIRAHSKGRFSLDNLMIDLLGDAQSQGTFVSANSIDVLMKYYLVKGVREDIKNHIVAGDLIVPDKTALGPYVKLRTVERHQFELGFDYETSIHGKVTAGVKRRSNAYRAGLRNGQIILGATVFFGDVTKMVEIRVKASKVERTIKFYPLGRTIAVPQYELKCSHVRSPALDSQRNGK